MIKMFVFIGFILSIQSGICFDQVNRIKDSKSSILFVCTGNYYRSRFAQAVFNYYFGSEDSQWKAYSRGFNPSLLTPEQRKTHASVYAIAKLKELHIPAVYLEGQPTQIGRADLDLSQKVIGLDRKEHEPMFRKSFEDYDLKNVEFWDVPDGDKVMEPSKALDLVYCNTLKLGTKLTGKAVPASALKHCH